MKRFRIWLSEDMKTGHEEQLHDIWMDTFKALGIAGLADEDAAQQSLSKITYNNRNPERAGSTFRGKQAVRKRLENGQVFSRLEKISDPEIRKNIEDTRKWLDTDSSANASTTISNLLQKMFGQDNFQKFIDSDFPKADQAKAQVQPMPPKQSMGQETPAPNNSIDPNTPAPMPMPPNLGAPMMPQPTNPMPPKPAGAELGMF